MSYDRGLGQGLCLLHRTLDPVEPGLLVQGREQPAGLSLYLQQNNTWKKQHLHQPEQMYATVLKEQVNFCPQTTTVPMWKPLPWKLPWTFIF